MEDGCIDGWVDGWMMDVGQIDGGWWVGDGWIYS